MNFFNVSAIVDEDKLPEDIIAKFKDYNITISNEFSKIFADLLENKIDIKKENYK